MFGAQLDEAMETALTIMRTEHAQGHDDRALRAIDRVVVISARLGALWGTDAPQRRMVEVIDQSVVEAIKSSVGPDLLALLEEGKRLNIPPPPELLAQAGAVGIIDAEEVEEDGE